jgi:hypothetical protein
MDRPSVHTRENQRLINRRQQGDLGEVSAIEWFSRLGATIFMPFGHSPDVDLVVQLEGRLLRIQVKTSTFHIEASDGSARWEVRLATMRGSQSRNRVAKVFDPSRFDVLFVLVADGRRWAIPSGVIEGIRGITLGGTKYREFEVDPATPIEPLIYRDGPPLESSRPARGSAGVGEPGSAVNRVPQLLSGFESLLPHQTDLSVGPSARTRISANHQITIPLGPFRDSGLGVGDAMRVTAAGDGHLLLDRIEPSPASEQSGAAHS